MLLVSSLGCLPSQSQATVASASRSGSCGLRLSARRQSRAAVARSCCVGTPTGAGAGARELNRQYCLAAISRGVRSEDHPRS